jgi:hypothetical protein
MPAVLMGILLFAGMAWLVSAAVNGSPSDTFDQLLARWDFVSAMRR